MADAYDVKFDRWNLADNPGPHFPARQSIAVTPSDTKDVTSASGDKSPCYAKSLYVGVAGDLTVICAGDSSAGGAGTSVLYKSVPVGWFPVQVRRVLNTGTTAQSIVGLYDF